MRKIRRKSAEVIALAAAERRAMRMIATGGLTLRKGIWRFGPSRVGKAPVERLIAAGRAVIRADRCIPAPATEVHP